MKRMKKGYYFTLESLLGILILTSSFLLINNMFESLVPLPDYRYATDIMGFMTHITVSDICSNGCEGLALEETSKMYGIYNKSLLNMIGYTYYKAPENVTKVTADIFAVGGLILRGKNVAVIISGIDCNVIYSTQNKTNLDCDESLNSTNEVMFRKVIHGYVMDEESSILDFWGDYVLEVRVW